MLELNQTFTSSRGLINGTKNWINGLVLVAVLFWSQAAPAAPVINSLSYSFQTGMANSGVEPTARAMVFGNVIRRGATDYQRLIIMISKLHGSTTYHLVAFLNDSGDATAMADITTDRMGGAFIVYVKSPPRMNSLPAAADPLTNLRELDIVNNNGDTVFQTDLTDPNMFSYAARCAMNNTGFLASAGGVHQLIGGPSFTTAWVVATGLAPATSYQLQVNGVGVTNKTSDAQGNLTIFGPRTGLPLVLDIRTVELADSTGTNIILGANGQGIPGVHSTTGQGPVVLGAAANFAVLAGSTVTSINATTINGDLGLSPGSAVTGFPPGIVNGTMHVTDPTAAQAKAALTIAYNDAKGRTLAPISVSGNLGGQTLAPGLYKSTSSLEISSGDLTLDAKGDANAVFIFQMASTLTTTSGRQVILIGNAKAANIFWQVGSSATLGTTSVFKGTIMADQSISLTTGATLDGRALARIGAVTMDSNTITVPGH